MQLNKDVKLEINGIPVTVIDMDVEWEYKTKIKDIKSIEDLSIVKLHTGTVKVKINKRTLKLLIKYLDKQKENILQDNNTKILNGKHHMAYIRAINMAKNNGWKPSEWPYDDAKFEIGCCLPEDDLLNDKDFRLHLGEDNFEELLKKLNG